MTASNHGQGVKEYCSCLDGTPPHSYMRSLRTYPQADAHWRDYILLHEYFHGENGEGLTARSEAA